MSNKIKLIEKANKIVVKIKALDAQITSIERLAIKFAEGKSNVKVSFEVETLMPDEKEDVMDSVGFLKKKYGGC